MQRLSSCNQISLSWLVVTELLHILWFILQITSQWQANSCTWTIMITYFSNHLFYLQCICIAFIIITSVALLILPHQSPINMKSKVSLMYSCPPQSLLLLGVDKTDHKVSKGSFITSPIPLIHEVMDAYHIPYDVHQEYLRGTWEMMLVVVVLFRMSCIHHQTY